jgi:hypothetical protein
MSNRLRLSDGQRFAILVALCLGLGSALCLALGLTFNAFSDNPALCIAAALVALAISCWAFIKLVNWLFRGTY